jgi:hypothetical protein
MDLHNYILIDDFVASEILPGKGSLEVLCQDNDYVIEKWREYNIGKNFHFVYKIYLKGVQQDHISVGDWRIEKIRTPSSWVPQSMLYHLVDPTGQSSFDKLLPYGYLNKDTYPSPSVPFTGYKAFNLILSLAMEASKHNQWLPFLIEKAKYNLETIHTWYTKPGPSMISMYNERIIKLEDLLIRNKSYQQLIKVFVTLKLANLTSRIEVKMCEEEHEGRFALCRRHKTQSKFSPTRR